MARKTITFTPDLEDRIHRYARRRGLSFSAAVVEVLEEATSEETGLPYAGVGEGPEDLGRNAEKYLEVLSEAWRD